MKQQGSRCELVTYEGQPHGFFNFGRSENKYFLDTLKKADAFLVSLGYLKGEPTVDQFAWKVPASKVKNGWFLVFLRVFVSSWYVFFTASA